MRKTVAAIGLLLLLGGCRQSTSHNPAAQQQQTSEALPAAVDVKPRPVELKASDGATVFGRHYQARSPKALILLFHQAGSSKDEYATIAPRLVAAGYSALAIDQRAGGGMYGTNETAAKLGKPPMRPDAPPDTVLMLSAMPDMQAALDWAQTRSLPIVLWGSSYSSSLIFPLAAGDPKGIVALLAFSPGEYFEDRQMIRRAAAKITVPVLIASTNAKEEKSEAGPIMAALPKEAADVRLAPEHAVHGSSTLIESRNPEGASENWAAVLRFLNRATAHR